ncbi:MAG: DUF5615 family PIN-like protein [Cyanobacteria bacterium J06649_11]
MDVFYAFQERLTNKHRKKLAAFTVQDESTKASLTALEILIKRAEGLHLEDIQAYYQTRHHMLIEMKRLQMAEAYAVATASDAYEVIAGAPMHDFRVLLDENISQRLIPRIYTCFGKTKHVSWSGMQGEKDPAVWQYAANRSFDMIITRDKKNKTNQDLTRVAFHQVQRVCRHILQERKGTVDLHALPLLVHVRNKNLMKKGDVPVFEHTADILGAQVDGLAALVKERKTPCVLVTKQGITEGPSYGQIMVKLEHDLYQIEGRRKKNSGIHAEKQALYDEVVKNFFDGMVTG